MGILSDRQIEAEVKIVPFSKEQTAKGVISSGLSSFGYDARCGYRFKVFSNVWGSVVDPKAFDPKAFVDVDVTKPQCKSNPPCSSRIDYRCSDCCEGDNIPDHVLIPPNSFALAETVEHITVPRDCLALVIGKCLTGDTRILNPSTGELVRMDDGPGDVATVRFGGPMEWDAVLKSRCSKLVRNGTKPVFKVRTHSGLEIRATDNHPFMVEGEAGGWTPLHKIKPGDKILRANFLPFFGDQKMDRNEVRLLALMIADGQCSTPGYSPMYAKQDPRMVRMLKRAATRFLGCEVTSTAPHRYGLVNHKGRGGAAVRNKATVWLESHGLAKKSVHKFVPPPIFTAPKGQVAEFLRVLFSGDGSVYVGKRNGKYPQVKLEYSTGSKQLAQDVQHLLTRFGVFSHLRVKPVKGTDYYQINIHRKEEIARFFQEIGFVVGSFKDTFYKETVIRYLPSTVQWPDDTTWDSVVSITPDGTEPVYDIEVPKHHNFVANDLVVHNSTYARCGIVLNCTPLEPEWEGKVTLEISNTTPLPAKIYAGEGIGQVLFFRSDEYRESLARRAGLDAWGVMKQNCSCRTSYAGRKGRYQSQTGLTLPFVKGD